MTCGSGSCLDLDFLAVSVCGGVDMVTLGSFAFSGLSGLSGYFFGDCR